MLTPRHRPVGTIPANWTSPTRGSIPLLWALVGSKGVITARKAARALKRTGPVVCACSSDSCGYLFVSFRESRQSRGCCELIQLRRSRLLVDR